MIMRTLLTSFIALYSFAASAADLPDPTRPPAMIAGTSTAFGRGSTEGRSSGLQSTIISGSRRAAIIDGKTVELWAKHGNAQLIEVNEGSVVLRGRQRQRVLTLFPGVKMTLRKAFVRAPEREVKTNNAPPDSAAQPDAKSNIPAAQDEQLLSGHPKEKK